jgi:hypothetical protein
MHLVTGEHEQEDEMTIGLMLLNAVLMGGVALAIGGGILWAIATQHRDHGVVSAGPLLRRSVWPPPRRSRRAASSASRLPASARG